MACFAIKELAVDIIQQIDILAASPYCRVWSPTRHNLIAQSGFYLMKRASLFMAFSVSLANSFGYSAQAVWLH
jgi:hypothetical protein